MSRERSFYHWVSSLPRPSLWLLPQISHRLPQTSSGLISGVLIARRKEDTRLAFFLVTNEGGNELWLGDFDWVEQMEVTIFSLFSNIIQLINSGLDQPLTPTSLDKLNPQQNQPLTVQPSMAKSTNFPVLFTSAMFYLCLLYFPLDSSLPLLYMNRCSELVSPELLSAIGTHHQLPYCSFFGSYLSYSLYDCELWNIDIISYVSQNSVIHSYAVDDCELWKIGIFSPVQLMKENKILKVSQCPQKPTANLREILACQQLECIIQLRHSVDVKASYITVEIGIDNVRCGVSQSEAFVEKLKPAEKLMCETERYFPSRIIISVVPQYKSDDGISSLSVGQSSHNPAVQCSTTNNIEFSFQTPKDFGIKASSAITSTRTINYWQFDMPATGVDGCFEWILYHPLTQLEITSSKPPKRSFLSPNTWNINRHKKACSPFNNKGGVIFAGDKYGPTNRWRMNKNLQGKILKWKVEGTVWLTYWPNKHTTSFYHTTSHNFSEEIELQLTQSQSQ